MKLFNSFLIAGAVCVAFPALATPPAGDAVAGKKAFVQCQACHTVDAKAPQRLGPSLFGVMGSKVAGKPGYVYSAALRTMGGKWDDALMDRWLVKPSGVAQGTKMAFLGVPDPKRRKDMIAYLKTLK